MANIRSLFITWSLSLSLFSAMALAHSSGTEGPNWVNIKANTKEQRTALANAGISIESVKTDSVYGTATDEALTAIRKQGFKISETFKVSQMVKDFPNSDSNYHNYEEMMQELDSIIAIQSGIFRKFSIGRTYEGRDIWAIQINTSGEFYNEGHQSAKPGIVFMGNHHAREHLSAEVPLKMLRFLAENYGSNADITRLMDTRDIFIIPMVNPDGVEYDISTGSYKMHRKNKRDNHRRNCVGVDLNRNYGYQWGTGGSSNDVCSDVYMGPEAFSEPETQSIKAFVENRPNLKILLSFHTFSELILYPWGHSYDPINDQRALTAYQSMARTMAQWNGYTPQQSSDLYIASGDTTDWSWGTLGIFSFTFELSPKNSWGGGGFYPGDEIIDRVFQDNLRPVLFLIELADDPYRVLENQNPLDDPNMYWLR